jgi:hypothetical protein
MRLSVGLERAREGAGEIRHMDGRRFKGERRPFSLLRQALAHGVQNRLRQYQGRHQ